MARIQYVAKLAVDRDTGLPVSALEGQEVVIVRRGTTTPAAISEDEAGTLLVPGAVRTVSSNLFIPSFWVDTTEGPISALGGGVEVPLESVEGVARRLDVLEPQFGASVAAAEGAQAAAEATTTEVATLRKWIELGVTRRNYCTNPRAIGRSWSKAGSTGIEDRPTTGGPLGMGYQRYVPAAGTTSSPISFAPTNGGASAASVVPGRVYAFSAYGRALGQSASSMVIDIAVNWYTAGGANVSSDSSYRYANPGQWTRYSKTLVAPEGAAFALITLRFSVAPGSFVAGGEFGADHFMVEDVESLASLPTGYFDGDTPPAANRAARWSGTPNASISELLDMSVISEDLKAAAERAADAAEAAANTNLPSGGNTGQVLAKRSGVDRDTEWVTPSGGSGGGATTWDQISGKPATYPASTHTHTLSQLSDMSGLGRQVAGAGDAQTIRGLIGAGTGNGTSNLTLGTTASTAAAGNHTHTASSITFTPPSGMTATNVQDAIVQASQTGGGSGGGTNTVYIWKQSGGAYPALPSTKPAGVEEVAARGAQSPIQLGAVIPSWIGAGTGKASLEYLYNPTLT